MRILIVSGEYPPMKGGVGRYTYNLVSALRKRNNIEIFIAMSTKQDMMITSSNNSEHYIKNGIYYDIKKRRKICIIIK